MSRALDCDITAPVAKATAESSDLKTKLAVLGVLYSYFTSKSRSKSEGCLLLLKSPPGFQGVLAGSPAWGRLSLCWVWLSEEQGSDGKCSASFPLKHGNRLCWSSALVSWRESPVPGTQSCGIWESRLDLLRQTLLRVQGRVFCINNEMSKIICCVCQELSCSIELSCHSC